MKVSFFNDYECNRKFFTNVRVLILKTSATAYDIHLTVFKYLRYYFAEKVDKTKGDEEAFKFITSEVGEDFPYTIKAVDVDSEHGEKMDIPCNKKLTYLEIA